MCCLFSQSTAQTYVINQQLMQQILMSYIFWSINGFRGRETVRCMPCFTVARVRVCVQTCVQGCDCTTCEIEHTACVSVCMWSACGRLSVAMEIPGKAYSRRRLGSCSLHHLGILTLWLRFSCRIFTHLTSHMSSSHSAFTLFIFSQFVFIRISRASLPLTGSPFNSNASNRP